MRSSTTPSVYSQVAVDLAAKIARGDIAEGQKISGRSLTSSEYGVSPETIRRAFRLLSEMEIVDIQKNSGAIVLSKSKAAEYVMQFDAKKNMGYLKKRLYDLIEDRNRINNQIVEIVDQIIDINERFRNSDPLRSYEFEVHPDSPLVNKTIGESEFWQKTGATIVALRRDDKIILSPGPYAVFMPNDVIIVTGEFDISDRIDELIKPR